MKGLLLQPGVIISSLFVVVLVGGGVYVGVRVHNQNQEKDAQVARGQQLATTHASVEQVAAELAKARSVASAELERLNLFINYASSPQALAVAREEVYDNVLNHVMDVADDIAAQAKLEGTATPALQQLQQKINEDRQKIADVLQEWKKLVNDPVASVAPGAAATSAGYAQEVKTYIDELKKLVDQLTPDNSGLTPAEIAADQNQVNIIIEDVNQAISDINQPSVPPSIVQQQQQEVKDTQSKVDDLQQTLTTINNPSTPSDTGSGTTPDTSSTPQPQTTDTSGGNSSPNQPAPSEPSAPIPGTRYVPPLPAVDPNKPKLIEGTNVGQ
jgi:hypothetical protein